MVFVLAVQQWTRSTPSAESSRALRSSPNRVPLGILWEVLWEYFETEPNPETDSDCWVLVVPVSEFGLYHRW